MMFKVRFWNGKDGFASDDDEWQFRHERDAIDRAIIETTEPTGEKRIAAIFYDGAEEPDKPRAVYINGIRYTEDTPFELEYPDPTYEE